MESPFPAPLTADQIAAINASGGFAQCEDPTTHTLYHLIPIERPILKDDYVRRKIDEAYAEAGDEGFQPLDMNSIVQHIR